MNHITQTEYLRRCELARKLLDHMLYLQLTGDPQDPEAFRPLLTGEITNNDIITQAAARVRDLTALIEDLAPPVLNPTPF